MCEDRELVNATTATSGGGGDFVAGSKGKNTYTTVTELLDKADQELTDRFESLGDFLLALGDDVRLKTLKYYFAFKRLRNFACVEVHPNTGKISLYLKVNPDLITLEEGFTRDVRTIGHFGTGELEITITTDENLERAKPHIVDSYEKS